MIAYQSTNQIIESGISKTIVSDFDSTFLLERLLKEMKKMNLHLLSITDEEITNEDIEGI